MLLSTVSNRLDSNLFTITGRFSIVIWHFSNSVTDIWLTCGCLGFFASLVTHYLKAFGSRICNCSQQPLRNASTTLSVKKINTHLGDCFFDTIILLRLHFIRRHMISCSRIWSHSPRTYHIKAELSICESFLPFFDTSWIWYVCLLMLHDGTVQTWHSKVCIRQYWQARVEAYSSRITKFEDSRYYQSARKTLTAYPNTL